jgi:hypothetical protein
MLPDMMKDEAPNDSNFIVFGVVNRYKWRNQHGEYEYRSFVPLCIRFGRYLDRPSPEEEWLLETFDVDKMCYRTYALSDIQPR